MLKLIIIFLMKAVSLKNFFIKFTKLQNLSLRAMMKFLKIFYKKYAD